MLSLPARLLVSFAAAAGLSGLAPVLSVTDRDRPEPALVAGLAVWRKPGAIENGAACATCHSPDGIELAAYAFDDADILRRAQPHLGPADCRALVAYIHALRAKHHFTRLLDPMRHRPLQPGGSVLPGRTPAERDLAFGRELAPLLPHLFNGRIDSVEEARIAERELLRVRPTQLRVGIPFDRLSEDVAHGDEHASIDQWLPEAPPAVAPGDLPTWYAAEDDYLRKPNPESLHGLLLLHTRLVDSHRMPGFDALSAAKFRALLVLQDRIRSGHELPDGNVSSDVQAYGNFNPIWQVGEVARQIMDRGPGSIGMPPDEQAKKLAGPSFKAQLHDLRVAWFWAGWLSDEGLFKTSHDDKTRLGMWFSESLSKDGPYPIHNVFANARRQAVVSNDPTAWGETAARKRRIWDFAGLRSFDFQTRDIPTDADARAMYLTFTANCFRMNLWLLEADLERTHVVWVRRNARANVAELVRFVNTADPADAGRTTALQSKLDQLIDGASERI